MKALALVALAAMGCGGGRSLLLVPRGDSTNPVTPLGPDAARDVLVNPSLPDAGPVSPDASGRETQPLPTDGPQIPDGFIHPTPDLAVVPPPGPDSGMEVLPPPSDAHPELPPTPVDARPDLPPILPADARPDRLPATPDLAPPDLRPIRPDALTPPQLCADGEACSSDCTTTCQFVGTRTCACTSGTLACGACQPPHIVVTRTPCPENASGTACDSSGVACPIYTNGNISGVCACLDLGGGTRWICL